MVKHIINTPQQEHEDVIEWSVCLEDGVLRLVGRNKSTPEGRNVISIYRTGKAYRHYSVGLAGLDTDNKGRIREYSTPQEAHSHGRVG